MPKKIDGGKIVFGVDKKKFDKGIRGIEQRLKRLSSKLISISNNFKAVAVAGVASIGFSIKKFATFETGLAEIATLGVKNISEVKKSLEGLRKQYGINAKDATKAYYDIRSAGAKTHKESIQRQKAAIKLAKAGNTSLDNAIDIVTTAINVFGKNGETATSITDKLFSAVKDGKTTVEELGQNLGSVATIAETAGLSFEELTASYAVLTSAGIDTTESTTAIKAFLTSIIKPSAEASIQAKKLGLEFNTTALKSEGLAGFLQEVKDKTGGNIETMGRLFGSVRALNFATATLSDTGLAKLKDSLENAKNSAGATDEAFKKISNTINEKFKRASENFGVFAEQMGLTFWTALEPVFIAITKWFNKISSEKGTQTLTSNIILLTTSVALLSLALFRLGGMTLLVFGAKGFIFAVKSSRALIIALKTLTFTVRGLMAATGFGLIIVGISLIIEHWDKLVAVLKKYSLGNIIKLMWLNAKIYLNKLIIAYEKTALAIQDNALFKSFGVDVDGNISKIKELTSEIEKFNDEINSIKKDAIELPEKPKTADETVSGKPPPTIEKVDEFKEKLQAQTDGNLKLLENQLEYFEKKAQLELEAKELETALDSENAQLKLDINAEQQEALDQQHLEFQEKRAEADLAYKEIVDELNLEYDQAEFERLFNNMTTVDDLKKQERDKEILEQIKQRALKKRLLDKDLKITEKEKIIRQTSDYKSRVNFQNDLLSLAKEGSKAHKAIQIASGIADMGFAISVSAPAAYAKAVALDPVSGQIKGAVAYAAIVAKAVQGLSQIRSMNEGGVVGGVAGIDNNTTNLSQGELIVPNANFNEVIDAVALSRTPQTQEIVLNLDGEIVANIVLSKLEQEGAL